MKIYNSLSRKKKLFKPRKAQQVGMYVCGPTVYDEPHIGHARAAYIFEVVRAYLEYKGYRVKLVRNITDVDDKIIAKAKEELPGKEINEAVKAVAEKYTQSYYQNMAALGIPEADSSPRATEHIGEMKKYISRLIERGFAYEVNGDVYFAVSSFADYGKLSQQNLNQMRSGARINKEEKKKDALDFALWKKAKPGEPYWDSPWGCGRPGWHIECSVMASIYLGDEFDIHAGGRDLIFPHHENEIAQSRSASGKRFARIWMHNGLLTINGQKMAKSLGNFISEKDFLKENIAEVLKLFFLSAHYRSPIDYNQERIEEARKNYQRFQIFFDKLNRIFSPETKSAKRRKANKNVLKFKKRFAQAMDDDFNTPAALAALFDLASFCNKLLVDYKDKYRPLLESARDIFSECSRILGLNFARLSQKGIAEADIKQLIETREALRKKGNFAEADRIRKELKEKEVILEDAKEGTIWRRKI